MDTMTNAGGTVSYSYNALELRVGKTGPTALVPTGAAYYVYDEAGKLLGEYDANGILVYETIYLGIPVGVVKQTGTAGAGNIAISLYNISTDQLGAPRIITRQSDEAIVWRWDSAEAFGATAPDQNPGSLGTFTFNQRLPGQVFDAESGLFQNWNRDYDPRGGHYRQSDPIGLAGGINTFAYVGGNPLSNVDPNGLQVAPTPIGPVPLPVAPSPIQPSPKPIDPTDPRPAPNPLPDLLKPSPVLPTWNWDGITWPDRMEMAAPGNQADTQIAQDYERYASNERLCGRVPMDRCAWLAMNAGNYRPDQVKATEKAWGCRGSRYGKGGKTR